MLGSQADDLTVEPRASHARTGIGGLQGPGKQAHHFRSEPWGWLLWPDIESYASHGSESGRWTLSVPALSRSAVHPKRSAVARGPGTVEGVH
jgi:hypothetical protein